MKKMKSVADHQNYGDEPEAIDILFPATFTELGVTEYDFMRPRPKEDVKALFEKIGFSYKIGKFNAIFNRGVEYTEQSTECPPDYVSIRGFMLAVKDLHHIE